MGTIQTTPPTPLRRLIDEQPSGFQTDLARRLKMGEAQLSKYANGKLVPGIRAQRRIAKALDVEREELWPS